MADMGIGEAMLIAAIFSGVTAVATTAYSTHEANVAAKKVPKPSAPDPNKATADAQGAIDKQRRTLLLSGGETSLTGPGGSPILAEQNVSKTLLGS